MPAVGGGAFLAAGGWCFSGRVFSERFRDSGELFGSLGRKLPGGGFSSFGD